MTGSSPGISCQDHEHWLPSRSHYFQPVCLYSISLSFLPRCYHLYNQLQRHLLSGNSPLPSFMDFWQLCLPSKLSPRLNPLFAEHVHSLLNSQTQWVLLPSLLLSHLSTCWTATCPSRFSSKSASFRAPSSVPLVELASNSSGLYSLYVPLCCIYHIVLWFCIFLFLVILPGRAFLIPPYFELSQFLMRWMKRERMRRKGREGEEKKNVNQLWEVSSSSTEETSQNLKL